MTDRISKQWWAVSDRTASLVTGFSCGPNNPKSWWCPEIGYTLHEDHHLFDTELDAIDAALSELGNQCERLVHEMTAMKARRTWVKQRLNTTPKTFLDKQIP